MNPSRTLLPDPSPIISYESFKLANFGRTCSISDPNDSMKISRISVLNLNVKFLKNHGFLSRHKNLKNIGIQPSYEIFENHRFPSHEIFLKFCTFRG